MPITFRIDLQPCLEILLRKDRLTGCYPANEGQSHLLADGVLQLNASGSARNERDDALAGQCPQMLLGGVGRTEPQLKGDLGPRRRHPGLGNEALDQAQDLSLARGEVGHINLPVYIYSYCDFIQIEGFGKR
jgi:hypothetical protein